MSRGLEERELFAGLDVVYARSDDSLDVEHTSLSMTLSLGVRLSREVELSLAVPWRRLEAEVDLDGIGDLALTALWTPWEVGTLSFLLGLRVPTGENDLDEFAGSIGEVIPSETARGSSCSARRSMHHSWIACGRSRRWSPRSR